ncbi:MAG: ATP-dependent DNA helicase [Candidatus Micrarchaeota archaeon]
MPELCMAIWFRHDSVRPSQRELIADIHRAVSGRKILLANAPTGSGKTDAALSVALSAAIEQNLNVFFLTPKISQHKIAMEVVNGIAEKHSLKARAADIVGRSHCCIDGSLASLDNESFHTACTKKRKGKECDFYTNARGYSRPEESKAESKFRVVMEGYGSGKSHHEMISLGRKMQCCPYEWLLKLAESSQVIIADYYHIMVPHVRDVFLMKVKKRLEDSIIIVDEAHNLASRLRGSLSRSVNSFAFSRMAREMRFLGMDAGPVAEEFESWAGRLLGDARERAVSADDLGSFIGAFGLTIDEAIERLDNAGEAFVEKTGRKSACLRLARFMEGWPDPEPASVRILRRKGSGFQLSKRILDPSPASGILNECHSAILMSGTLMPLEMHRDVLGLSKEKTMMRTYPSPFDPKKVVNIITEGLTTRYSKRDAQGYAAIASALDGIIAKTPGGSAAFFASYEVMNQVLPLMRSRGLLVQKPGMKPPEIRKLLRDFRGGGVLCGVQGGSLAEGVDYSGGEIKTAIVVGVGLDEMGIETRALIDYYDEKLGRGWDYGYIYPGTMKALQAAGRGRRKDSDRVAIVYMDERFMWNKYNWILDKSERAVVTSSPEEHVEEFWKSTQEIPIIKL